jgi:hypothetical protein
MQPEIGIGLVLVILGLEILDKAHSVPTTTRRTRTIA